jgi:UDP-N-acetylmuramate dehydrogenase
MKKTSDLSKLLGKKLKKDEPLSWHTFLKIGGPADWYYEADNSEEFLKAIKVARSFGVSITMLGDGSNVLVSDEGIRGLVLVNKSGKINILEKSGSGKDTNKPMHRWESDSEVGTFKYEFKDLDYDESDSPRVKVNMESGVKLPKAIDYLLDKGITGLQWYAGIPGTIGGAIFNNIHGGTHFISEVLLSVRIVDKKGKINETKIDEMGVDYDKSRFQESGEIIIDGTFSLFKGDVNKARFVREEWAKRKSLQPRNAPGCAFHNLTQEQKSRLKIPTTSTGFVIEHLLKMSQYCVGDACVSEKHHNFIVNKGKATAQDYLAVMKKIYKKAKNELGITLVPEIFLLGFDEDMIKEFRNAEQTKLRKKRNMEIRQVYKDSKKLFEKEE